MTSVITEHGMGLVIPIDLLKYYEYNPYQTLVLRDEVTDWLAHQGFTCEVVWAVLSSSRVAAYFKTSDDLIAFKLRWC